MTRGQMPGPATSLRPRHHQQADSDSEIHLQQPESEQASRAATPAMRRSAQGTHCRFHHRHGCAEQARTFHRGKQLRRVCLRWVTGPRRLGQRTCSSGSSTPHQPQYQYQCPMVLQANPSARALQCVAGLTPVAAAEWAAPAPQTVSAPCAFQRAPAPAHPPAAQASRSGAG